MGHSTMLGARKPRCGRAHRATVLLWAGEWVLGKAGVLVLRHFGWTHLGVSLLVVFRIPMRDTQRHRRARLRECQE
jgi:hypothetical protein